MCKTVKQKRDESVDIFRGFATLIVIISHVIQKFGDSNNSLLFNAIFSIQIPIFMMVSGYVRNYSEPIISKEILGKHIRKKIFSVLIPWLAWSIAACFLLRKMSLLDYVKVAAFKMEIAFWFLFSLFTIDLIFSVTEFIAYKLHQFKYLSNKELLIRLFCLGGGGRYYF